MHLAGVTEGTFTRVGRSLGEQSFTHSPFHSVGLLVGDGMEVDGGSDVGDTIDGGSVDGDTGHEENI